MRDLRDRLTAFAITVGDQPNFLRCLEGLRAQTVRAGLEVIENVAPMSAAFNEMHARCRTELFVQVDEDVQLRPWALEQLHDRMERAPADVCQIAAPLHDLQAGRPIYGVKIYRHKIVSRYPYRDRAGCDQAHNAELEAAGHRVERLPLQWSREACFGDHGAHYTPETAFGRWRRLFLKRRLHGGLDWIAPWPSRFLERYRRDGDPIDLYSFLGAMSAQADEAPLDAEHDFRRPAVELERIQECLAAGDGGQQRIREGRERVRETVRKLRSAALLRWTGRDS